ncbi:gluconate 2-dehydrogenase subunit 3 family protein [Sphingobium sp. AR-3-1]|uniref:Gluconate 2-dehydrogenase subunit 3 family protein n=1 Tax=Sphingobium psychrophilum TaxID=2728834 RepID=A0A7X9ZTK6_9SPHN|nr:gluconate 2-dehydrogenase subunit 3 family protein [Sphingobium psychrophilum]NML11722.1 gluconate 2-dehydrogenase subunit 3 family protein [Sphingobium psychrophilum]
MKTFPEINRRVLLRRALLLAGAMALPMSSKTVLAATAEPTALSAPMFALLGAVADTIVPQTDTPGAVDVGVPALFDALIKNWASPARALALTSALAAIDKSAMDVAGRSFTALSSAQRHDILSAHDSRALAPAAPLTAIDSAPQVKSLGALMNAGPVAEPAYAKLKELIVILYYYSEPALTQELTYEQVPGEWVPSIPLTPTTRQTGGAGLF